MGIIDCHGHLGHWKTGWNEDLLLPDLLGDILEEAGVEKVLVSNLSGIDSQDHSSGGAPWLSQREANLEILDWCAGDARLLPLAVCQPGRAEAAEIEAMLSLYRFYGLKFHPFHLNLDADDPAYDPFMEMAAATGLPSVFHSAPGTSDPAKITALAARHPRVPVVLYHINLTGDIREGIRVAKRALRRDNADIYLELSWVPADAPLDGRDHYKWYAKTREVLESLGSATAEAVLEGNSKRLFRI